MGGIVFYSQFTAIDFTAFKTKISCAHLRNSTRAFTVGRIKFPSLVSQPLLFRLVFAQFILNFRSIFYQVVQHRRDLRQLRLNKMVQKEKVKFANILSPKRGNPNGQAKHRKKNN